MSIDEAGQDGGRGAGGPASLEADAERFERLSRYLPALLYDYVIEGDGTSRCLYCSDYSRELLGVAPEVFMDDMGRFWEMIHPEDRDRFPELDRRVNREGMAFSCDVRVVLPGGREKWIRVSSKRNPPRGDQPAVWSGFMIDISETKGLEQHLQDQATHDYLTGTGNRQYLERHFQTELQRRGRYQRPSALLLLDLDHFKTINDRFGHDAGDFVLQAVVARAQGQLRDVDVLARWGGEEFCILLPETTRDAAMCVAERVRSSLAERPIDYKDDSITVTVSIGLTTLTAGDQRIETVIRRADEALYEAKWAGRNRIASR